MSDDKTQYMNMIGVCRKCGAISTHTLCAKCASERHRGTQQAQERARRLDLFAAAALGGFCANPAYDGTAWQDYGTASAAAARATLEAIDKGEAGE